MFDLTVEDGLFLDGTGSPAEHRDVAITDGRIVEIGEPGRLGPTRRRIDAGGKVVAPGFVDVHTHYDAQVLWDPYLSPSSLHGVTTVIGGNCGFSIAPLSDHDDGYMLRMLAEVEAIPAEALLEGAGWDWRSFGDYLDAVEAARPALNFGVMAGHSALRRAVLGARHTEPDPGPSAISAMRALLRDALSAGALGFSSSWNSLHLDGEGEPVPSRFSLAPELVALAGEVAAFPGTQLEFIPTVGAFSDEHIETMIAMSLAAGRTLNWNVLIPVDPDVSRKQLEVSDLAAARGAAIVALTYPGPTAIRARASELVLPISPRMGRTPRPHPRRCARAAAGPRGARPSPPVGGGVRLAPGRRRGRPSRRRHALFSRFTIGRSTTRRHRVEWLGRRVRCPFRSVDRR